MSTSNHRLFAAIAAFGIVQLVFLLFGGVFQTWHCRVFDGFFMIRSSIGAFKPPYDGTVVHIDLNDTSIQQLKTYYVSRPQYGRVIRNLAAMNVAAQAYDLIFAAGTNQADDQAIIGAAREARNVYFGMAFTLGSRSEPPSRRTAPEIREYIDRTVWAVKVEGNGRDLYAGTNPLITFPPLAEASKGIGFISLKTDRDGVIRRVPLLVRCEGGFYPSLPFRLVCDYLAVRPEKITIKPGSYIRLENARVPAGPARDFYIPIDSNGSMIINFIGPWGEMRHYNFDRILSASEDRDTLEMWKEELSGKIAVVSDVSTGATDLGAVPVDIDFPLSGLHANVIQTILSRAFLSEVSPAGVFAIELAMAALILLLSTRFSPVVFTGAAGLLFICYGASALALFLRYGLMLNIVRPVLSGASVASLLMVLRYFRDSKEKEALRRSFESYFPPSVVKKILADPAMISRGQRKELTILFSDIKDFTAHSSTYSPDRIRGFLNDYFETMVEVVFNYEGTVDKYIGDGLMVFFGDPEPTPDHALRAVRAAIEMQKKARELSLKWAGEGGFPVHVRIGINTGEVVVGNMGSSRRLSYTVLGSAVNLAKRLESSAPVDGILISQRTRDLVSPSIPTRFSGEIRVKGVEVPVRTYEVASE
ncbi:Adenylate/guanylate cyclase [Syntrophobacter sp. SbD1]|nr:Adenylate/guanylate cyclase [Syntrophobacter sp. SbD1]